jgi:hypothetical protein
LAAAAYEAFERLREAGEVLLLLEHDPRVLVGEHLVAEVGEGDRERLVDVAELLLLVGRELRARRGRSGHTSARRGAAARR